MMYPEPGQRPQWEHDCADCTFLGRHEEYDLYFCHHEPTVIARAGSHGGDYVSGISFVGQHRALTEAARRALYVLAAERVHR